MTNKNPLEKEVQSAILDYLSWKKDLMYWRQNTNPTYNQKAQRYQAMPKHSLKGVPDIIVIKNGKFIGLECKRKGEKPSEFQISFMKKCILNGGEYHIVTSIDDVRNIGL